MGYQCNYFHVKYLDLYQIFSWAPNQIPTCYLSIYIYLLLELGFNNFIEIYKALTNFTIYSEQIHPNSMTTSINNNKKIISFAS